MTCVEIERDEIAEQYVGGTLAEEARARFEEHYFDCSRCLGHVERLASIRDALASVGTVQTPAARPRRLWRAGAALAAAAVVVLAVRVMQEAPSPSPFPPPSATPRDVALPNMAPSLDLERLGAADPPPFTPPRLRSDGSGRETFLTAMDIYNRGDYAGAIPGLEEAVRADGSYPAARFFLGVSYLQLDRRAEAIQQLQQVTRLGESPYLEDAHWFLAKAFIRGGDIDAARRELRTVVMLDGDRREDASRLLEELQRRARR